MTDQQHQLYVKKIGRAYGIMFDRRFLVDLQIKEGDIFTTKSVRIPKERRIAGETDEVLGDRWLVLVLHRIKKTGIDRFVSSLED